MRVTAIVTAADVGCDLGASFRPCALTRHAALRRVYERSLDSLRALFAHNISSSSSPSSSPSSFSSFARWRR